MSPHLHKALDENQRSAVWNALCVAKDQYITDAKTFFVAAIFEPTPARAETMVRVMNQFLMQAREAEALLEDFE